MTEIGYYRYEGFDLRTKFGWINGAIGVQATEPARIGMGNLGNAFLASDDNIRALLAPLGVDWQGRAAEAAAGALAQAAQRGGTTGAASDTGSSAVAGYGQSFEALRPKIAWQDPGGWDWWEQGVDAVGVGLDVALGDVFDVQSDFLATAEQNRTLDAQANEALYGHEQVSRERLASFPGVESASAPTTGGAGDAGPAGGRSGGGFTYGDGSRFAVPAPNLGVDGPDGPALIGPSGVASPPPPAVGGTALGPGSSTTGLAPAVSSAGTGPGNSADGSPWGAGGAALPGTTGSGRTGGTGLRPGAGAYPAPDATPDGGAAKPGIGAAGLPGYEGTGRGDSRVGPGSNSGSGGSTPAAGGLGGSTPGRFGGSDPARSGGAGSARWSGPGSGGYGGGGYGGGGYGGGGYSGGGYGRGTPTGGEFAKRLPTGGADPWAAGQQRVGAGPSGTGAPRGTGLGAGGHMPFLGGMGAGAGAQPGEHKTKYWIPSSEAFDVDLPPHTEPVIEGRDER